MKSGREFAIPLPRCENANIKCGNEPGLVKTHCIVETKITVPLVYI
jgi:hypothetical protein